MSRLALALRVVAVVILAACGAVATDKTDGASLPVTIRGPVTVTCGEDPPTWAYSTEDDTNTTLAIPLGLRCMIWRGEVVGWGEITP